MMFRMFRKRPVTASEIGKLGAMAKRHRERAKVRAMCDEMRRDMRMEPAKWPE